MQGKHLVKPRSVKRGKAPNGTPMIDLKQDGELSLAELMQTAYLIIPGRVGSDLSGAGFVDKLEPPLISNLVKCRSPQYEP